jgi:hypothetical protein
MRNKSLDLDLCPTASSSSYRFCGIIDKPSSTWFWGPNKETVAVILRPKSPNRSCRFWGPNRETLHHWFWGQTGRNRHHRFWGQTGENRSSSFETKPLTSVSVVLKPNHWEIVDFGFEAQLRNPRSSSPRARCRLHTVSSDLPIVWPPSTRPVRPSSILYTRSPTPVMILIAVCHATSVTCTPRDKQTQFSNKK